MIKIIDLGHAKFIGEVPYPNMDAMRFMKYRWLDLRVNGGPCSPETDLYSVGFLMMRLFKGYNYECPIYMEYWNLVSNQKCN